MKKIVSIDVRCTSGGRPPWVHLPVGEDRYRELVAEYQALSPVQRPATIPEKYSYFAGYGGAELDRLFVWLSGKGIEVARGEGGAKRNIEYSFSRSEPITVEKL